MQCTKIQSNVQLFNEIDCLVSCFWYTGATGPSYHLGQWLNVTLWGRHTGLEILSDIRAWDPIKHHELYMLSNLSRESDSKRVYAQGCVDAHSGDILNGDWLIQAASLGLNGDWSALSDTLRHASSLFFFTRWRQRGGIRNGLIPFALAMVVILRLLGKFLKRELRWRYVSDLFPVNSIS